MKNVDTHMINPRRNPFKNRYLDQDNLKYRLIMYLSSPKGYHNPTEWHVWSSKTYLIPLYRQVLETVLFIFRKTHYVYEIYGLMPELAVMMLLET